MDDVMPATYRGLFSMPLDKTFADYQRIVDLLAKEDPECLIKHGAPHDEYSPEAEELVTRLASEEIMDAEAVRDVFAYFFGCYKGYRMVPRDMAERIARGVSGK